MTTDILTRPTWWPGAMLASGASFLLGGLWHPQEDEALAGAAQTSAWLADPAWVPAHLVLLLAEVLLVVGLVGLLRAGPTLAAPARAAGWAATAAAVLWVAEGVPHVLAAGDAHAVAAGHATPSFGLFQSLSVLVYPLVGLSVCGLAVLAGRRLTHPALTAVAVVGGLAYAAAPVLEGVLGISVLDPLYAVGLLMGVWFAAVGGTELVRRRSTGPVRDHPTGSRGAA